MPTNIPKPANQPDSDIQVWEPAERNAHLVKEQKKRGERVNMREIEIGGTHKITATEPEKMDPAEAAKLPKGPKTPGKLPASGDAMVEPVSKV